MNPRRLTPLAAALVAACSTTTTTTSRPVPQEQERRGNSETVHTLGIPPGHLPSPGQCRVWIQGRPPGQQARARSCTGIASTAPAGSWIIYRPGRDNSVHVHVMDPSRQGIIYVVRFYNTNGRWLKDESSDDGDHNELRGNDDDGNKDNGNQGNSRRRPS